MAGGGIPVSWPVLVLGRVGGGALGMWVTVVVARREAGWLLARWGLVLCQQSAAMWAWAAVMACASGQASRMRTMSRWAWRTMRAGACQSRQRSVLGSAEARLPVRQSSW